MSLILDEHREYLSDGARVGAFDRAIAESVRPGDVVVDVGAGTGILGLLACRAGAARVYGIDAGDMVEVARSIARANGFGDRMHYVHGLSTEVVLPERADVIISDQIGRFGFELGLPQYYRDARERFLKPGGTLMPSRLDLWTAPVEHEDVASRVRFWDETPAGFDMRAVRQMAANSGYPVRLEPDALLAPATAVSFDPCAARPSMHLQASWTVARAGTLHGIGAWFSAQLSRSVVLTNAPGAAGRIKRRNVVFPIDRAVKVEPGDLVNCTVHVRPLDVVVSWRVEVVSAGQRKTHGLPAMRFSHSTLGGMLLTREALDRTNPAFRPVLSPRGRARRSVLELTDGCRTLAEVEEGVASRHPDLFPSPGDAQAFVAGVIASDAE